MINDPWRAPIIDSGLALAGRRGRKCAQTRPSRLGASELALSLCVTREDDLARWAGSFWPGVAAKCFSAARKR